MLAHRLMSFVVDMTALALSAVGLAMLACLAFPPLAQALMGVFG
jgi:hypothetical protein